jgi:hypothetical protein
MNAAMEGKMPERKLLPNPRGTRCTPMIRSFLCCAAVAAMTVVGAPALTSAAPAPQNQQGQQAQPNSQADQKTVTGKVTAVGSDRHSFTLETNDNSKKSMQFLVDNNTQVTGRVGPGATATVQYQTTKEGQNLATVITPQSAQ